jgi:hypothetical protein
MLGSTPVINKQDLMQIYTRSFRLLEQETKMKERVKKVKAVEKCGNVKRLQVVLTLTKSLLIIISITARHGWKSRSGLKSLFLLLNKIKIQSWMRKKRNYLHIMKELLEKQPKQAWLLTLKVSLNCWSSS